MSSCASRENAHSVPDESGVKRASVESRREDLESRGSSIDEDVSRAETAYKLMLAADAYLKSGAHEKLEHLGFSPDHIADLKNRAGPGGGYPRYALRNIRWTIKLLQEERASLANNPKETF